MAHTLTIASAHTKLRAKEISAVELVTSCLNQIDQYNDQLNAVLHDYRDAALEKAKVIDNTGVFDHALTGIPYLVKDVFNEQGRTTTACSNMLRNKDYVSPFNATTIDRLNAQNAISLGKVNTDEFTMGASTESSCYGPSKNPWDITCTPGGSSGGSSAAVASHECLFALGTDTGGSIRQPAAFCGTVGLRSTYGRTSRYGVLSMASSLDTVGSLTKTVADTAIVLEAIAGFDIKDSTTSHVPVPNYSQTLNTSLKGKKIGIPKEYFVDGMNTDIVNSIEDAKKVLRDLGADIVDISLPHTKYATATYYILCPCEVSSNMARYDGIRYGHTVPDAVDLIDYYKKARSEGFGDEVKRRIMIGTYALSAGYYDAYYRKAQKVRRLIKNDFDTAFTQVDAIISPCTPGPAFPIGAHQNDPVAMYLEDIFLSPQVLAGIPALSVPCGFTKNPQTQKELPLGLQIMGPQWCEAGILNIGHMFEQATDYHTKVPSLLV